MGSVIHITDYISKGGGEKMPELDDKDRLARVARECRSIAGPRVGGFNKDVLLAPDIQPPPKRTTRPAAPGERYNHIGSEKKYIDEIG